MSSQLDLLADLVCMRSAQCGFSEREPWMRSGVAKVLDSLRQHGLPSVAWAALTAAEKREHRTPAGIAHEMERLRARQAQAAADRGEPQPLPSNYQRLVALLGEREADRRMIDHGVKTNRRPGSPEVIDEVLAEAERKDPV